MNNKTELVNEGHDAMKFVSKFATGIMSRALTAGIRKATGLNVKLRVRKLDGTIIDNKTRIHIDIDAELTEEELNRLLEKMGV